MPRYRVINTETGAVIGEYSADSNAEALNMLAKDAGFEDYQHATDASVAAFEVARPNRFKTWLMTNEDRLPDDFEDAR